ncbi:MAG TPA: tripartite tricarboxylate transporter TctB family protein [Burkholderiales bacterium]|nr:tripartite tricarboxylate transporter TctB family protein [Burkholderiales bacterium]
MSVESNKRPALRLRAAEIGLALFLFALGAIVIYDSLRLGIRWEEVHGPQPGYFPFYLGVLICFACAVTIALALRMPAERNKTFVEVGQLKLVLSVLVPSAVFVALVGWIGIYVSAVLFVALFMRWLGKYPWWKVAPVSVGHSVLLFLIFEIWFLIPLPKGPLERVLGVG